MSSADDGMGQMPPTRPRGWFEPTPEKLMENLTATRARFGEDSFEYASTLVQLGDAHMMQGRLSNPQAQASYESALQLFRTKGEETPETVWLYDKLASVKQSSGDTLGAQVHLEKALNFWKDNPQVNSMAPAINENYIARRREDLQRLIRLNEFKNRKPPVA